MHFRKLVLMLGVMSLSKAAFGLGLGDIELNSSLNQPLDAHIALEDMGELGSDQIKVQLGSQEDFDRAGIERSFFYSQLRFNVVGVDSDDPFIAVTSRDPVREPFLSFIVDVRWTSGRVLREYTLLLDLPAFSDDAAAPVEASVTPIRSRTTQVSDSAGSGSQSSGRSQPASLGEGEYRVQANDTLWEIARDFQAGGVSIHQTMVAIQRANPDAFINNNINLLREGQVLRVPATDEIRSLSRQQAVSQVAQQNRDWSGDTMGAPLDASGRDSQVSSNQGEVAGRVKLSAPGTTADSGASQGGGYGENDGGALARELAATEEELERTKGENSELRSRVGDLEEQIETMERLLEVSNEQLRALELSANQQQDEAQAETPAAANDEAESESEPQVAATDTVESAEQAPAAEEQPAEPEEKSKPVNNASTVVRRAPEPSFMDKLMANIHWIGLALLALIVGLLVFLRKRSSAQEPEEEFSSEPDDSAFMEPDASDLEADEEPQAFAEDDLEATQADDEVSAEAETGDVVGEADIYIAYGKYDQAEEMLKKGLEKDPESLAIKLKLLEVYAESENLEAFDEYYGQVLASGDEDAIARAADLRSQFSGAPAYVAGGTVAAAGAVAAEAGSDLLDSHEPEAETEDVYDLEAQTNDLELEADQTAEQEDDFSFDLDGSDELTLDDLEIDDTAADAGATQPEESNEEFSLDDELTLDEGLDFDFADDESADKLDADDKAVTEEDDLQGSETRYDLSFDEELEPAADDQDFDFDLELEDDNAAESVQEESLDVNTDLPKDSADELELDAISDGDEEQTVSLGDEKPLLDEDLDFSFDESFEPEDEPAPRYDEPEPYGPTGESQAAEVDDSDDVPTLDLTDDEDDFDLEKSMDDVDLEALDREMSDLDAPELDAIETSEAESPEASEPDAQASDAETAEPESFDVDDDDAFDLALGDVDSDPDTSLDLDEQDEQKQSDYELDDLPTPESVNEADDDEDLDFLADSDEVATKLDLARAYIDMGDMDGARDILAEVTEEGDDSQKQEAKDLLDKVDS
ncbi:FimV/HubP family polar landmark protein [Gilvimarinus xylanilyticus]|uniref:LysM peptidoglycan-binding domain-containing protein n=1 Tax=Gilvimarinus xylanilyticus TaxID=2944139 RepID=A0A9X2KT32_9GAMM|nr:FimV/HubP family polar landmark protein [Gilvimarinus xylanilyticus]MCP8898859.1 LysM peptidoglycan-binding domain-containing protein [Gilvimarinus xylanilyticus]